MIDNKLRDILIILGIILTAFLFIPPFMVQLIIFPIFSILLIFSIIKLWETSTLLTSLVYVAGAIIGALMVLHLIKSFAGQLEVVLTVISIIACIMILTVLTFTVIKVSLWFYRLLKKNKPPIN